MVDYESDRGRSVSCVHCRAGVPTATFVRASPTHGFVTSTCASCGRPVTISSDYLASLEERRARHMGELRKIAAPVRATDDDDVAPGTAVVD